MGPPRWGSDQLRSLKKRITCDDKSAIDIKVPRRVGKQTIGSEENESGIRACFPKVTCKENCIEFPAGDNHDGLGF